MIEKAELGTFIAILEDEVDAVEKLDSMETEDVVETNEAVVATVRLIFLSTWTAQILISQTKYGAS